MIALVLLFQLQIPQPQGFVNDFARVIDERTEQSMLAVIQEVRSKSGGEIAVVTLPGIEGRASIDVARDIGRQWGVGAQGGPGDPEKNAGVVLLLVPGERPGDGRAQLAIGTGRGAEGFVTDARAGRIRDAIGQAAVETGSYGQGLFAGVFLLAEAYAEEFAFEITGTAPVRVPAQRGPGAAPPGIAIVVALLMGLVFISIFGGIARGGARSRYRRGYRRHGASGLEWLLLGMLLGGGRRGGGWHGGGGWGGGGFGGGGFGGFGGGGGFSGGGASGSF